ncbi:hypothetical protein ACPCHT_31965 [Nucisporomicrobium flavum]|uniref:hypothetical protein n=1 Tax=Nucisporomicrobium flavum TaxID=2785915 RepID=UPI003C2CFD94
MPQTHPIDNRPPRAPVALFLRPTHDQRPTDASGRPLPDWYGVHPDHLAHLITRCSAQGDTVLDTDAHPTVVAAAEYLHRLPGLAIADGQPPAGRSESLADHRPTTVRLVMATLPRIGLNSSDVHTLSQTLTAWQQLLHPGGYLIVLLTAGPGTGTLGHRSTVVAAARTAGLRFHQHIPALLVPLPETEPRTEAHPAVRPPLLASRHMRTHRDLLIFATTAAEAADA